MLARLSSYPTDQWFRQGLLLPWIEIVVKTKGNKQAIVLTRPQLSFNGAYTKARGLKSNYPFKGGLRPIKQRTVMKIMCTSHINQSDMCTQNIG